MFENNEFFNNHKNCRNEPKTEVKLPNVNSGVVFGIIALISSAIGFAIMFGGYSILNISEKIADLPFSNIKLMIFVALIVFSLAAIAFGIIGVYDYFKKGKSETANIIGVILSILGVMLGIATAVISFIVFFVQ